jgi:hypothetical protein
MSKTDQQWEQENITGRDGFIIGQALYGFIKQQRQFEATELKRYEWSNCQDAIAILAATGMAEYFQMLDELDGITPTDLTIEKDFDGPERTASATAIGTTATSPPRILIHGARITQKVRHA